MNKTDQKIAEINRTDVKGTQENRREQRSKRRGEEKR